TFPEAKHVMFACCCQFRHRGKGPQEALKVGDDGCHLGLLQHDLADPDAIGVPVAPPGQLSLVPCKPGQEPTADPLGERTRLERGRTLLGAGRTCRRFSRPLGGAAHCCSVSAVPPSLRREASEKRRPSAGTIPLASLPPRVCAPGIMYGAGACIFPGWPS